MAEGLAQMAPADSEYAVLKREYARYRAHRGTRRMADGRGRREPGRADRAARGRGLRGAGRRIRSFAVLKRWQDVTISTPTGRSGQATFAALNVPAAERAHADRVEHGATSVAAARARPTVHLRQRPVVSTRRVRFGAARAVDESGRRRGVRRSLDAGVQRLDAVGGVPAVLASDARTS